MTPIDTVYEYGGYKLAGILRELLGSVGLPLIVALGGVAWMIHQMAERGSIRELGVYVLYLIFAAWLLSPVTLQKIPTPRFVAYLGGGAELLQKRTVRGIHEKFLTDPFEWERVAASVGYARMIDPELARDTGLFLDICAKPALARTGPRETNLLRPGALEYTPACEQYRGTLWARLREHVGRHPFHRGVLETAHRRTPDEADEFLERYLDRIVARQIDDPAGPLSESQLVAASLGTYGYTDPAQSTLSAPDWVEDGLRVLPRSDVHAGKSIFNLVVSGVSALEQSWSNTFSAKQRYYLVTLYGPHVYGLALMVVIGLFPLAGLVALLPRKWSVLVNYGKVFVSIKLWPVCWAALSSFNARRSTLEAFEPAERGSTDVFLAISAMYLLTPVFCFLVVHLATTAAAAPFAPAVPPPSGPGAGPVGPAVNVAARVAKA